MIRGQATESVRNKLSLTCASRDCHKCRSVQCCVAGSTEVH